MAGLKLHAFASFEPGQFGNWGQQLDHHASVAGSGYETGIHEIAP
jgi:hypothetical protein